MFHDIILICTNAFELYVVYRFMHVFFSNRYKDKQITILTYLFRFAVGNWLGMQGSYPLLNLVTSLLTLFCIISCYCGQVRKKMIVLAFIQISMLITEAVIAIVIGASNYSIFGKIEYIDENISIILQIILWLITVIMGKFKNLN